MEIFGIGMGELMLLLVLALIVVGPQKLPEIGRNLGTAINTFKTQTDALRSVMNFDLTTLPPAQAPAGPPPPSDERVTALHEYLRTRAAAPDAAPDSVPAPDPTPAPLQPDQEQAS